MKDFELIYEEFHIPIYKYLMKLTGNQDLSQELTQETFVQAYSSILRYNGKCSVFTWLCAIAKNCYFKHLRKNRKYILNAQPLEHILFALESNDPKDIYETKESVTELTESLMNLKKSYRDAVVLRIYFECSYQEIAQILKISESNAKVRYHRGIEELKKVVS